jgi:hypothetical protein
VMEDRQLRFRPTRIAHIIHPPNNER